jgi:CXXC-20-CXXC protein
MKCPHCNAKLSWFAVERSIWIGYKPLICKKCSKTLYFPDIWRWTFHLIVVVTPIIIYHLYTVPFFVFFYFIWAIVISMIAPYVAIFRLKEKC